MKKFVLKPEHILLLQRMYIFNGYLGSPVVNQKRPYGNSSILEDVAEIVGIEMIEDDDGEKHFPKGTREKCLALHRETAQALQVCLAAQSFEPGEYVADDYMENWKRV